MAFPVTPLPVRVDLQVGGVWTDVTSDTLGRDRITIVRGRRDESSRADPSTCALSFKNQAGKYSAKNPRSPYYGLIGRNTPLRVGIGTPPLAASSTGLTGTSLVAPSVAAETAGTMFCSWIAAPVGNVTVPVGFSGFAETDGTLSTMRGATKAVTAGATGTATATYSVAATAGVALSIVVPGAPTGVLSVATVDSAGIGIILVPPTLAYADYMLAIYGWSSDPDDRMQAAPADPDGNAEWMLVADTGPSTGPRIKAYMKLALTGSASPPVYFQGAVGVDTHARIWKMSGATVFLPRFTGEVSSWPAKWDLSGKDVWVPIVASGITRRLGQGASPLRSSLYREFLRAPSVTAYWPMEDGAGSTTFASAVGGSPMAMLGSPQLAADDGFACSDAIPTFTAGGAVGAVPSHASTGEFLVGALVHVPDSGMVDGSTLLTVACTGTARTWSILWNAGTGRFQLQCFDPDGVLVVNTVPGPWTVPPIGIRCYLYLSAETSGADVAWSLTYIPIVAGSNYPIGQSASATLLASTVGRVTSVSVGARLDLAGGPAVGHVLAARDAQALFTSGVWRSLVAWNGEPASDRVQRLCRDEGVHSYIQYDASTTFRLAASVSMGPQRPATLLDLLRECETADGGTLHEPRGFLGLVYRTRASKYNQATTMGLDYGAGNISEPFDPVDDDQGVVNDVTVNRPGGSSARAVETTGPMSVQAPPAGVARYDTSVEVNVATDAQLPDLAAWRVHVGTWDEARYPSVHLDLAKNPLFDAAVAACDVGDLVTLSNLPLWVPPGPVDQILEGYTETLGHPIDWDVVGNHSPAGPYRVGVLDSPTLGRLDSLTSSLNAGVTAGATSLAVKVTAGSALWITTATFPTHFPFTAALGGEEVTVTAITGTSSPQTWTVTRAANGISKAHVAGTQIRLARPIAVAL